MDSKPFWQSKTFWANLLIPAFTFAASQLGVVSDGASDATTAIGFVNLILRFVTKGAITLR